MQSKIKFAVPLILAVFCAPGVSMADGASSSSASGFSWFGNVPQTAAAQERANARLRMVINTSGTWICSPAGSGKRSTCVSG